MQVCERVTGLACVLHVGICFSQRTVVMSSAMRAGLGWICRIARLGYFVWLSGTNVQDWVGTERERATFSIGRGSARAPCLSAGLEGRCDNEDESAARALLFHSKATGIEIWGSHYKFLTKRSELVLRKEESINVIDAARS